jgi:hypothetical protein
MTCMEKPFLCRYVKQNWQFFSMASIQNYLFALCRDVPIEYNIAREKYVT